MFQSPAPEITTPSSFVNHLAGLGLSLRRGRTVNLQINIGLLCNQLCAHCRLDAGPWRREIMDREIMEQVIAYASRGGFEAVDITGGAPELHDGLEDLILGLAPLKAKIVLRSNLTALNLKGEKLMSFLARHGVAMAASFAAPDRVRSEAQRGAVTYDASLRCLRQLNALGYGRPGTGLELDLVTNPPDASLPRPESDLEKEFRAVLEGRHGIVFNRLYSFTNIPLGRFRSGLEASDHLGDYQELLRRSFNPSSLDRIMCRNTVAVAWDGLLYDCDFNIPVGLYLGGAPKHVGEMTGIPAEGAAIALGDHCYACTAGAGFT